MSYKLFRFDTAFEGFFSGVKLLLVVVIAMILFGFFITQKKLRAEARRWMGAAVF